VVAWKRGLKENAFFVVESCRDQYWEMFDSDGSFIIVAQ
jgi:hypothetical protein